MEYFAITDNVHIFAFCHLVQLPELLLFHVVVSRRHNGDYQNCQQDRKSFEPTFSDTVSGDPQSEGNKRSNAQYSEHRILKILEHHVPQRFWWFDYWIIFAIFFNPVRFVFSTAFYAFLK